MMKVHEDVIASAKSEVQDSRVRMYTIRDHKADRGQQPFFAPTDGFAIRLVENSVNSDRDSLLYKYPEDFSLYFVGLWDDDALMVEGVLPKMVIGCDQLKRSEDG